MECGSRRTRRPFVVKPVIANWLAVTALLAAAPAHAEGFNILDFAPSGTTVDRVGKEDASAALAAAIKAANVVTATGSPACVYIPPGTYRIVHNPPEFARAGCVKGDGPTQATLQLDPAFAGDLFTWSEAWYPTTPGPTVVGLRILGSPNAPHQQNALVFYDRNDEVFLDQVEVNDLPGRALYSGATQHTSQAYMRESRMRSLRFFRDGKPGIPVVEFSSAGTGDTDATNEIRISQIDIYGARGPSFVVRNAGAGAVRSIAVDTMRIEAAETSAAHADLLTIGDKTMRGRVNNLTFTNLELVDVPAGSAALRLTAADGAEAPYLITVYGLIGGGLAKGKGLVIDSGRTSSFHFVALNTNETNVVVGAGVSQIYLDGAGAEACWTYRIDPTSQRGLYGPAFVGLPPATGANDFGGKPLAHPRC